MGACNFATVQIGKFNSHLDAYRAACEEAREYYGSNPYNGSISTTSGCIMPLAVPRFETKAFRDWESRQLEKLDKWGPCCAVEITGKALKELKARRPELNGKRGIRAFYFFGWAAE